MRDTRRARIVLAILVLISVTLIILDLRGSEGGPLAPLRAAGEVTLGPLERASAAVVIPVRDFVDSLGSIGEKDQQIADLQAQNDSLRAELDTVASDKARVADLDALLGLVAANGYETVPAQVIAVGPAQGFAWTVTLDVGSRDGVERDMSVISGKGLVGRIISVGPSTSTVLLIVDATSSVGGRLSGTSQIGIVSGTGRQDVLQMQLLDPLATVEIGDVIVTYGSEGDRPYAPGIPIGTVSEMKGSQGQLTRSAVVQPYVDISQVDIVGVVLRAPERTDRQPITPSATPTTTAEGG
ncbi:MAG: rod shape-determining protein MreC [Candidatus Nanopelagicales bacterium]